MSDVAIKVEQVSKKFCRQLEHTMLYGVADIARSTLGLPPRSDRLRQGEFWAVNDVSFELKRGETLGIIGPNGAGKTTILKMLNGIFMPDKGEIRIKGRVGALIEIGAGFHPMLTGRENIYIGGAILGMSKKEIDKKFDSIVEFADISNFIDFPVKHYSSGMYVRLGFAVAVHCEPDILLIDEVLAVGDTSFHNKCFTKIGEMRKKEVSVIFVSHNMHLISGLCNRVLYFNAGQMNYDGEVGKGINFYLKEIAYKKILPELEFGTENIEGTGRAWITKIQFLDKKGISVTEINTGDPLILRIHYTAKEDIGLIDLDILIKDDIGDIFFQTTSKTYQKELSIFKGTGYIDVKFDSIPVNDQRLLFYITLWRYDRNEFIDCKRGLSLYISGEPLSSGKILLNVDWISREHNA